MGFGDINITVIGNLTSDPELRFIPSGAGVANFTVATTPRRKNIATGEWEDGDATFLRCNLWRQPAEFAAENLKRGDRVIVVGVLKQRSYETKEGEKRSTMELEVEEIGPSMKFHPARSLKPERGGGQAAPASGGDDPWGSSPKRASSGGFDADPPF